MLDLAIKTIDLLLNERRINCNPRKTINGHPFKQNIVVILVRKRFVTKRKIMFIQQFNQVIESNIMHLMPIPLPEALLRPKQPIYPYCSVRFFHIFANKSRFCCLSNRYVAARQSIFISISFSLNKNSSIPHKNAHGTQITNIVFTSKKPTFIDTFL